MLRRSMLSLLAVTSFAALTGLACGRSANLKTLTVDEVASRIALGDGKTFIFDDNPHDRYVKGHLPGAKWLSTPEPTAADLPADKSSTLVFYCASEL